ncbi:MAG: ECF transporter S component [bacterium]|jgi:niacin transporter
MKSKELAVGGLLTALALIIPLAFGGVLGVVLGPFSATLASHVPMLLAMLVSPFAAVMVGLGSAFGFLVRLGPVVGARAAVHALAGYVGAKLIQRGVPYSRVLLLTLPVHAVAEAIVVIPFVGFTAYVYITGVGTAAHHLADSGIALALVAALRPVLGPILSSFAKAGGRL